MEKISEDEVRRIYENTIEGTEPEPEQKEEDYSGCRCDERNEKRKILYKECGCRIKGHESTCEFWKEYKTGIMMCDGMATSIINKLNVFNKPIDKRNLKNLYKAVRYEYDLINDNEDIIEVKSTRLIKKYTSNHFTFSFPNQKKMMIMGFFMDDSKLKEGQLTINFKFVKKVDGKWKEFKIDELQKNVTHLSDIYEK